MLKEVWTFGLWCMFACILLGCGTHYQWTKSHPAYKVPPRNDLAVAGADRAFVLIRSAWFAKKLNISADSIQTRVTTECARLLVDELKKRYGDDTDFFFAYSLDNR